jgi:hypothetical protein
MNETGRRYKMYGIKNSWWKLFIARLDRLFQHNYISLLKDD